MGMFSCNNHWKFWTFWILLLWKKLEYRFLVESTKSEKATFPYKTALSEVNVKTNRMGSTKWTIIMNRVLPVTTLFFWKFGFSLTTSYKELLWCTKYPNAHIHTFCKCWSFIWEFVSPVSIIKFSFFIWKTEIRKKKLYRNIGKSGIWESITTSQKLGPHGFWWTVNRVLNKGKSAT